MRALYTLSTHGAVPRCLWQRAFREVVVDDNVEFKVSCSLPMLSSSVAIDYGSHPLLSLLHTSTVQYSCTAISHYSIQAHVDGTVFKHTQAHSHGTAWIHAGRGQCFRWSAITHSGSLTGRVRYEAPRMYNVLLPMFRFLLIAVFHHC
jgi:hypothetical protein